MSLVIALKLLFFIQSSPAQMLTKYEYEKELKILQLICQSGVSFSCVEFNQMERAPLHYVPPVIAAFDPFAVVISPYGDRCPVLKMKNPQLKTAMTWENFLIVGNKTRMVNKPKLINIFEFASFRYKTQAKRSVQSPLRNPTSR